MRIEDFSGFNSLAVLFKSMIIVTTLYHFWALMRAQRPALWLIKVKEVTRLLRVSPYRNPIVTALPLYSQPLLITLIVILKTHL